jgi:uncharacterized membrane protein YeaQ/YmgE (transglycosylase-associated protein family)
MKNPYDPLKENPYDTLKVTYDAEPEVIKAAWYALGKLYAPRLAKDDQAATQEINAAYQFLKDPEKKKRLDDHLAEARAARQPDQTMCDPEIDKNIRDSMGRRLFKAMLPIAWLTSFYAWLMSFYWQRTIYFVVSLFGLSWIGNALFGSLLTPNMDYNAHSMITLIVFGGILGLLLLANAHLIIILIGVGGILHLLANANPIIILINPIIILIVGGILGWLARIVTRTDGEGIFLNVVIGIVGAFLAGFVITPLIGGAPIISGNFDIRSLVASFLGAVVLLAIVNMFRRGSVR